MPKTLFERMSEAQSEANTPPVATEADMNALAAVFDTIGWAGSASALRTGFAPDEHDSELLEALRSIVRHRITSAEALIAENARLREELARTISCLCSVRKNYEEENGLWVDVSDAIVLGSEALETSHGE
jgi:hypothetical protein